MASDVNIAAKLLVLLSILFSTFYLFYHYALLNIEKWHCQHCMQRVTDTSGVASRTMVLVLSPCTAWRIASRVPLALSSAHTVVLQYVGKSTGPASSPVIAKPRQTTSLKQEVPVLTTNGSVSIEISPSQRKKTKAASVEEKQWRAITVDSKSLVKHYLMLSKIRLTSLVVITSMAGYAMAASPFSFPTFVLCSGGTGLVSCAANSINQFSEVPFDSQMSRTKNRVLVKGLLTPLHAVTFAALCSTVGLSVLYWGVNELSAGLAASNLALYTMVYTPMKRISILNTWVGSVVGAIPPMIGWAGCDGTLSAGAWVMAGMLYAWQFPHFNALSWNLRPDYSRAGYRMMAVTNPGLCKRTALRYTVGLAGLSFASPVLDVTTWTFAVGTLPLNGYFMVLAWQFYRNADSQSSRKLFRFSLIHLPALMLLLLISKKHWATYEHNTAVRTVEEAAPA